MKTILGLYDDHHQAQHVQRELETHGFDRDAIRAIHHHAAGTHTGSLDGDPLEDLTRHGVPRDEAEFFVEGLRRGGSLVVLRTDEARAIEAAELMNDHEAVSRDERLAAWREDGYEGYDADAPPYTEEEARDERARFADTDGDETYADYEPRFRAHHRKTFGDTSAQGFDFYAPAYQHGFAYGTADANAGRDYATLEPDMRRSYEQEHGAGTWDKVKDAARHAFRSGRDSDFSERPVTHRKATPHAAMAD